MRDFMSGALKTGIVAVVVLLVGAGSVFALIPAETNAKNDAVVVLKAQGVTCGSCAAKIERALKALPGVTSVAVDVDNTRVTVAYDAAVARPETLAETVTGLGYGSSILQVMSSEEYRVTTGKAAASASPQLTGGCGGGCCNRNRN
jgi:periplasmic mercuric ion binding protein